MSEIKIDLKEFAETCAKIGAQSAINRIKQEEKRKNHNRCLRNTGLLMKNYIEFLNHYEQIRYKASDIIDELTLEETENIEQDDIIIYSIKRSKIRTKIMISQIEAAVELMEKDMEAKGQKEKAKAIRLLYMDTEKKDLSFNAKIKAVVDDLTMGGMPASESSVRRWNNEMLDYLSVKLFGVDGLRLEI